MISIAGGMKGIQSIEPDGNETDFLHGVVKEALC